MWAIILSFYQATQILKRGSILTFEFLKFIHLCYQLTGCEVRVRHQICLKNLAQRPIEKRFVLLNVRIMSVEQLFVVKP